MSDPDKLVDTLKILSSLKEKLEKDIESCDEMLEDLSGSFTQLQSFHGKLMTEIEKKHKSIHEEGKAKSPINVIMDSQVIGFLTRDCESAVKDGKRQGENADTTNSANQYSSFPPLKVGDELVVRLTSIESPGCLFVRRAGPFSRLFYELNQSLEKTPLESLKDTSEGQACLFRRTGEARIYRARIDQGKVKLVDNGKTVDQSSGDVFEINEPLLTLPEMALKIKLANIQPMIGKFWGEKSTSVLKERIANREVVVIITGINEDANEALLFEIHILENICLNHWLVLEGEAQICDKASMNNNHMEMKRPSIKSLEKRCFACKVVEFSSASSLFVRKLADEDEFAKLDLKLQQVYKKSLNCIDYFSHVGSGQYAAVFNFETKRWERSKVVKTSGRKVELFLLDSGKRIRSKQECLKPLHKCFLQQNFIQEVYLANIYPPTNSGNWSKAANELLTNLLGEADMKVAMEVCGAPSKLESTPVKLYVEVRREGIMVKVDIERELVSKGYAKLKTIITQRRLLNESESKVKQSDVDDLYEDLTILPDKESMFLWPDHPPLTSRRFEAVASYVDWDCTIYLRPAHRNSELDLMNQIIKQKLWHSKPTEEDRFWMVGEAAMVKWSGDGNWYRAFVLEVFPNVCKVKLVDYGDEDYCSFEDMRKDLSAQQFPIQCFPFQLTRLDGKYLRDEDVFDLHEIIVDQEVEVEIDEMESQKHSSNVYYGNIKMKAVHLKDLTEVIEEKLKSIS